MANSKHTSESIKIGDLVHLKDVAIGYPMLNKNELGVGLILAEKVEEDKGIRLYLVLWTGTGKKRWEFPDDLVKYVHK
jgi:hypothetical protein